MMRAPALAQRVGDLQAEAARAAGDQRGLARQVEQLLQRHAWPHVAKFSARRSSRTAPMHGSIRRQRIGRPVASMTDAQPASACRADQNQRVAAISSVVRRRATRDHGQQPGVDLRQLVVEEVAARLPACRGRSRVGAPVVRRRGAATASSQIQASTTWPKACRYGVGIGQRLAGSPVAQARCVAAPRGCSAVVQRRGPARRSPACGACDARGSSRRCARPAA